jgi:hypothetical protein
MELGASDIDPWWDVNETLLNEHKTNEVNYRRKFKAYKEVYSKFIYESPSITPKNNFILLDMDQF